MKHISTIPIRFCDLDPMGHVNNAIYLNYFEQARMSFFHDNLESQWDWKKDGIVLARNEVDYLIPILIQDSVLIEITLDRLGNKSMTLSYEVFDEADSNRKVYARGKSVIVCFDYNKGTTIPVPDKWRSIFKPED